MRGYLPDYDLKVPGSLAQALDLMAREPGEWRPLAGGTDLMVGVNTGTLPATRLLDICACDELRGIGEEEGALTFGALTTFTDLRESEAVHRHLPNLVESARLTGALAVQNRGTIGGNIVNASPAADTPPSLLSYGATVSLISKRGIRTVAYDRFHLDYKKMDLMPDELLYQVVVPKPTGRSFHFFRKVGARRAQAVSKTCLAAFARIENGIVAEIRVGIGAVAPRPVRARNAEAVILGSPLTALPVDAARKALSADIRPIDDIRSTAHYRHTVTGNILAQMLRELSTV